MKNLCITLALIISSVSFGQQALGDVVGTVVVKKTKEPIYDARVFIVDQDRLYQTKTDPDGRFKISAVPAGKYPLFVLKDGDTMQVANVDVPMDGYANAGTILYTNNILEMKAVLASAKSQGLKLEYGSLPIKTITSEEIMKSPIKFDIKSLASSISTDVKLMDDGSLVFRGARKGDMIYMVDGMKVTGDLTMPSVAIGKMMVYSGGLPAKYGDTMGGVIVIESKGYFDLLREYQSQQMKKEAGL
jgi:hypothetical protein